MLHTNVKIPMATGTEIDVVRICDIHIGAQRIRFPLRRSLCLRRQIQQTLSMNQIPARLLASVVGKAIARFFGN